MTPPVFRCSRENYEVTQFPSFCDADPRSRSGQQDTRQSGMVSVGRICDTGEEGLRATGPRVSPGVCGRVAAGAAPLVPSVPGRGGAAAGTPSSCPCPRRSPLSLRARRRPERPEFPDGGSGVSTATWS
jgi:hypothetical protein